MATYILLYTGYYYSLLEFYLLSKRLISKRSTFAEIVERLSILFDVMFSILFHIRFIVFQCYEIAIHLKKEPKPY